jgi:CHAT domain-containing protein
MNSAATISDSGDDLLLAAYEGNAFASIASLELTQNIAADSDVDLGELIGSVDVVVVSTHGHTIELLTDATFGKLGAPEGRHLISVEQLQRSTAELQAKLVILNACHSGSKSYRNSQKSFITSDSVTIPSLFLLNRQAISMGSVWKVSDTASFILSCLVAESLRTGSNPHNAAARAISQLPHMLLSDVLNLLKKHLPEPIYRKASDRLFSAPEQGMFLHPYFTAGLTIYGLL